MRKLLFAITVLVSNILLFAQNPGEVDSTYFPYSGVSIKQIAIMKKANDGDILIGGDLAVDRNTFKTQFIAKINGEGLVQEDFSLDSTLYPPFPGLLKNILVLGDTLIIHYRDSIVAATSAGQRLADYPTILIDNGAIFPSHSGKINDQKFFTITIDDIYVYRVYDRDGSLLNENSQIPDFVDDWPSTLVLSDHVYIAVQTNSENTRIYKIDSTGLVLKSRDIPSEGIQKLTALNNKLIISYYDLDFNVIIKSLDPINLEDLQIFPWSSPVPPPIWTWNNKLHLNLTTTDSRTYIMDTTGSITDSIIHERPFFGPMNEEPYITLPGGDLVFLSSFTSMMRLNPSNRYSEDLTLRENLGSVGANWPNNPGICASSTFFPFNGSLKQYSNNTGQLNLATEFNQIGTSIVSANQDAVLFTSSNSLHRITCSGVVDTLLNLNERIFSARVINDLTYVRTVNTNNTKLLLRYNSDFTRDADFEINITALENNAQGFYRDYLHLTDGTFLILFNEELIKVDANGERIASFQSPSVPFNSKILPSNNDGFFIIGENENFNIEVHRYLLDGSRDSAFPGVEINGSFLGSDHNGLLYFQEDRTVFRLTQSGVRDNTFLEGTLNTGFSNVNKLVAQYNNQLVLTGTFTEYNGRKCNGIVRLYNDIVNSIKEQDEIFTLSISPNPNSNQFKVSWKGVQNVNAKQIQLLNNLGQTVPFTVSKSAPGSLTINHNLPDGIYHLILNDIRDASGATQIVVGR